MVKRIRRFLFKLKYKAHPNCDNCEIGYDSEYGCLNFIDLLDTTDWKHGLYPKCCKYY